VLSVLAPASVQPTARSLTPSAIMRLEPKLAFDYFAAKAILARLAIA
jgi:hypothetical protein